MTVEKKLGDYLVFYNVKILFQFQEIEIFQ